MSYRKPEQIESGRSAVFENEEKPWKKRRHSKLRKFMKQCIHKAERQRCRLDIEADARYKKYYGREF